ncbi:hypothetical protein BJX76DRAFT_353396 [Aspergillus varians]
MTTIKFDCGSDALQVKGILLATVLSLRLDIALITDFLRLKGRAHVKITEETLSALPWKQKATFISRSYTPSNASTSHLQEGHAVLEKARSIVSNFPAQTRGLASAIDTAENMFLSTLYSIVTNAERLAVVQAMASEFVGTGRWYYCQNGHPFTGSAEVQCRSRCALSVVNLWMVGSIGS